MTFFSMGHEYEVKSYSLTFDEKKKNVISLFRKKIMKTIFISELTLSCWQTI